MITTLKSTTKVKVSIRSMKHYSITQEVIYDFSFVLPLYPRTATAIVSRAHNTYSSAIAALSAQSFLHLVHSVPS